MCEATSALPHSLFGVVFHYAQGCVHFLPNQFHVFATYCFRFGLRLMVKLAIEYNYLVLRHPLILLYRVFQEE